MESWWPNGSCRSFNTGECNNETKRISFYIWRVKLSFNICITLQEACKDCRRIVIFINVCLLSLLWYHINTAWNSGQHLFQWQQTILGFGSSMCEISMYARALIKNQKELGVLAMAILCILRVLHSKKVLQVMETERKTNIIIFFCDIITKVNGNKTQQANIGGWFCGRGVRGLQT